MATVVLVNAVSDEVLSQCNQIVAGLSPGQVIEVRMDEGDDMDQFKRGFSQVTSEGGVHAGQHVRASKLKGQDNVLRVKLLTEDEHQCHLEAAKARKGRPRKRKAPAKQAAEKKS